MILLLLGKDFHNLIKLVRSVVVNIKEITETTPETNINTEEILHFCTITSCNDYKLTTIIFHALHQLLQSLSTLTVTFSTLTQRSKCISFVNKENTSHCLITKTIYHLGSFTLIGTNHLRAIYLYNMSAVEISNRLQYLT